MKIEKKLELEINIIRYRRESDLHVFTIGFDKNVGDDEDVREIDIRVFLVTDKDWFNADNCMSTKVSIQYDLFDEGNYHLLSTLFQDDETCSYTCSEKNFYKLIQELCIEYCKINKLPDCYYLLGTDHDRYNSFADDIFDEYEEKIKDNNCENFVLKYKYYNEDNYKKVDCVLTHNSLILKNILIAMEFERKGKQSLKDFINDSTTEYIKKFNEEIIGKYDWDKAKPK